jgi:hypothetical protein
LKLEGYKGPITRSRSKQFHIPEIKEVSFEEKEKYSVMGDRNENYEEIHEERCEERRERKKKSKKKG